MVPSIFGIFNKKNSWWPPIPYSFSLPKQNRPFSFCQAHNENKIKNQTHLYQAQDENKKQQQTKIRENQTYLQKIK